MRRMSPCSTAAVLRRAVIRTSFRHARRPLRRSACLLPLSRALVVRSASRPPLSAPFAAQRGALPPVGARVAACSAARTCPTICPPPGAHCAFPPCSRRTTSALFINPALCPQQSSGPPTCVRPCGSVEQPHPWGQHPVLPLLPHRALPSRSASLLTRSCPQAPSVLRH
ncbi:unnamed protein product, partial [Closterium sp. Naga37s-1]